MAHYNKIITNLYLGGSYLPSKHPHLLVESGITHIVNLANELTIKQYDLLTYLIIDIDDVDISLTKLQDKFTKIHQFIDDGIKEGKVYVHCNCGVSRSATIVISYLMGKLNYSLYDAFKLVKNARNIIQPNLELMKVLIEYELSLTNKSSFTLKNYMDQL